MKKFLRIVSIGLVVFIVVLIITFLYVNSGAFIRQCLLPWLSRVIDTEMTVQDARFSIFKGLDLINLRVGAKDELFLSASRAKISYNLFQKKNDGYVGDILLEDVVTNIMKDENGRLNLPSPRFTVLDGPFFSLVAATFARLNINAIRVNNLSVFFDRKSNDQAQVLSIAISEFNGFLDSWIAGEAFEISSKAKLQFFKGDHTHLESEFCTLTLTGLLGDDSLPNDLTLSLRLDQLSGNLGFLPVRHRSIHYDLNLERSTPKKFRIKHCNLSELNNNEVEGYLSVTGTLTTDPRSFDLEIVVASEQPGLFSPILDLLGPYKFGETLIDYQAKMYFDEKSSNTSISGDLKLTNFTVSTGKSRRSELHPINLSFQHTLSYDRGQKRLQIDSFNLVAKDKSQKIATVVLDRPVSLSLLAEIQFTSPSPSLAISTTGLDLAIINPFISHIAGFELKDGTLNAEQGLNIIQTGRLIIIDGGLSLVDATIQAGDMEYKNVNLDVSNQLIFNTKSQNLKIQHFDANVKTGEDLALEIKLEGSTTVDNLTGSLHVNTLKIYPAIEILLPKALRNRNKINNLNCNGNLRIGFVGGDHVTIEASLSSENIYVAPVESLSLPISPKLDLHIVYSFHHPVQLVHNVLTVESPIGQIASITFNGELDYPISSGMILTEINLDRLPHLMSKQGIRNLGTGHLSSSVQVIYDDNENRLSGKGDMQLCDLIAGNNAVGETEMPMDADIHLDFNYSKWKTLTVNDMNFWAGNQLNTYFNFELSGKLFLGPRKAPSNLQLTSLAPLDIKQFLLGISAIGRISRDRFRSNNVENESAAKKSKNPQKSKLRLTLDMDFHEVYYNETIIEDLMGTLVINQKKVTLNLASAQVNDGQLLADLFCDQSQASFWECNGSVLMEDVDMKPIFSSLVSPINHTMTGCLKTLDLNLLHAAIGITELVESLHVETFLELENLHVSSLPDQFEPLLNLLAVETEHLSFDTILGQCVANQNKNTIELFNANGKMLKLLSSGQVNFDATWLPDLTLTIGYSEELATLAQEKNIKMTKGSDGFFYTKPLPITIKSWQKSSLFSEWLPKFTTELFDLDPITMGIVLRIKHLGEIFGDQPTLEGTLGGIPNILNSNDKNLDKKNIQTSAEDKSRETE